MSYWKIVLVIVLALGALVAAALVVVMIGDDDPSHKPDGSPRSKGDQVAGVVVPAAAFVFLLAGALDVAGV